MTDTDTLIATLVDVAHDRKPMHALLARWPTLRYRSIGALQERIRRTLNARPRIVQAAHTLAPVTRADLRRDGRYLLVVDGTTATALAIVGAKEAERALKAPHTCVYAVHRK